MNDKIVPDIVLNAFRVIFRCYLSNGSSQTQGVLAGHGEVQLKIILRFYKIAPDTCWHAVSAIFRLFEKIIFPKIIFRFYDKIKITPDISLNNLSIEWQIRKIYEISIPHPEIFRGYLSKMGSQSLESLESLVSLDSLDSLDYSCC